MFRFFLLLVSTASVLAVVVTAAGALAPAASRASTTEVDLLAVDTNVTGNSASAIGAVNNCLSLAGPGNTATIDVVVQGMPTTASSGASYDLLYNPAVLKITAFAGNIKFGAGAFTNFSDPVPDTDGDHRAEIHLFTNYVSSDGTVARYTIEAVGAGASTLALDDLIGGDGIPDILDTSAVAYPITSVRGAFVVIGSDPGDSCGDPDGDGVVNYFDNCDMVANPSQANFDGDSEGDACDTDDDNDGVPDSSDQCPDTAPGSGTIDPNGCSQALVDADLDGVCDPGKTSTLCAGSDSCPGTNGGAPVVDANGCSWVQVDGDVDGVCNAGASSTLCAGSDNCPGTTGSPVDPNGCSQQQVDADMDSVCDPTTTSTLCAGSDNCPSDANTGQTNTDVLVNPPGDGLGDTCDPDDDNDSVTDSAETASAGVPSGNLLPSDTLNPASTPELCDNADNDLNEGFDEGYANNDGDSFSGHPYADCVDPDDDNDFFPDSGDNCQFVFNISQVDFDVDGAGDACDDFDGDGVTDDIDNCRVAYNPGQDNHDADPLGDVCDSEDDNDGVLDPFDNCPIVYNPLQEDIDADGPGDACDDSDGDSIMDDADNCYAVQNADQAEHDADGTGDACDPEDDGDGIFDGIDGTWNGSSFSSQSTAFSNGFTDQHLAGVSHGSILNRGGIYVQVSDLSAEGFLLWGVGAGSPGTVDVCNETQIIIGGGSIATASCTNSTVIRVIAGSVSARAGNLVAGLPVGANVVIEDIGQGYSIENTAGSSANITVNGTQLPPGTLGEDNDDDGFLTSQDNCPNVSNPAQQNAIHPAIPAGDHCDDPEPDGVADISDNCPDAANSGQENTDGDPRGDACELAGCETIATAWNNPVGDATDCDGFPDTVTAGARGRENFIGTDPADRCADDMISNNERGPTFGEALSPWPPDVNDSQITSLADLVLFGPRFNKLSPNPLYNPRFDLNASGGVTLADIVAMGPFFNKRCAP